MAELGSDNFHQELPLSLLGSQKEVLDEIAAAIQRINDGSYGRCVDCELEIDPARLEVLPAAARCSFCQELFERRAATVPAP
jgi:RNA polymerase-binding transcription factor DksA